MTEDMQTYQQAVDYLMGRINYERLGAHQYSAYDLKLDRMRLLLDVLGNPQESVPVVHIAGTKGKGSTAIMTASMLTAAGYRVGLYTSPHVMRLEERMTVNGRLPSETEVVALVAQLQAAVNTVDARQEFPPVTYFEILTAMAWLHFRQEDVDIVVLEVGLGGRLDSTNICRPAVTVITSISFDHMHILGKTLDRIAREKAGILKAGAPLVCGVTPSEPLAAIRQVAGELGVPIVQLGEDFHYQYRPAVEADGPGSRPVGTVTVTVDEDVFSDLQLPLLGAHQAHNAAVAVAAIMELRERGWQISAEAIDVGLRSVVCPVRMEVVRTGPITILDAAHNMASIQAFGEAVQAAFPQQRKELIFATTKDKPVEDMLRYLLPRFDRVVLTEYLNNPRKLGADELATIARSVSGREFTVAASPADAWRMAFGRAAADDVICVTGSFFIAAEIREHVLDETAGSTDIGSVQTSATAGPVG